MVNYIVSGIERSGTSMMMQILQRGGAPVAFNDARTPDYHNPRGYYELEGGKVIRKLMDGSFSFEKYENKVIKITAYGLKFLPLREYKIIYMKRDLDEIMDSMKKMSGSVDREKERPLFEKLNTFSLNFMKKRDDIDYIVVNYRNVIDDPIKEIKKINKFLDGVLNVNSAVEAVDPSLYRNVRK